MYGHTISAIMLYFNTTFNPLFISKKMFSATALGFLKSLSESHHLLSLGAKIFCCSFLLLVSSMCTEMVRVEILITHWFFFTQRRSLWKLRQTLKWTVYGQPNKIHLPWLKWSMSGCHSPFYPTQFFPKWNYFKPSTTLLSLQPGCVEWISMFSCSIVRMCDPAFCASAMDYQAGNSRALSGLGCLLPMEVDF